ncbi:MAG: alpha/beta hydrolase [Solirubrobacterales bacterium]
MNRLRSVSAPLTAGLLAAFALAALVAGCGGDGDGGGDEDGALSVVSERVLDPRLREYSFVSSSVPGEPKARVVLPPGYEDSDRRYPVLYLLHGAAAAANFWTVAGIERLVGDRELIVVMPDGDTSFYSNWFSGGRDGAPQWESFHVDELVPWVDGEFRTVPSKEGRAIAGNSMGGLGALLYAARHPDLFALAASFSGPVQVEPAPLREVLIEAGRNPRLLTRIWGPYPEQAERWRRHNPVEIAEDLEGTEIVLVSGDGRLPGRGGVLNPVEATIAEMNETLHRRLDELGIEHTYRLGPGIHDVPYWQRALRRTLPRIDSVLGLAPAGVGAGAAG